MWLPRDERRLILSYYIYIGEVEGEVCINPTRWASVLRAWGVKRAVQKLAGVDTTGQGQAIANKRKLIAAVKELNDAVARVRKANRALKQRGLIDVTQAPLSTEPDRVCIRLTLEGYDMGRRCSTFMARSGLWFEEYRNHWVWLVLSFLGGMIASVAWSWLSGKIGLKP
ncbi:MAG: hypothetical protein FJ290_16705 [Planctomycetes bacterium]|nr:hypothetical protein [Planctomycetota bacterium]